MDIFETLTKIHNLADKLGEQNFKNTEALLQADVTKIGLNYPEKLEEIMKQDPQLEILREIIPSAEKLHQSTPGLINEMITKLQKLIPEKGKEYNPKMDVQSMMTEELCNEVKTYIKALEDEITRIKSMPAKDLTAKPSAGGNGN